MSLRWIRCLALTALLAAGCGVVGPVDAAGDWQLEAGSVDGDELPILPGHRITLSIRGNEVQGTAACNGYGGKVSVAGGSFTIDEIGQTAMGCADDVMASEAAFMAGFRRITSAARLGDTLVLSGPNAELRFARLAPAPLAAIQDTEWRLDTLTSGGVARAPKGQQATLLLRSNGTFAGSTGCRAFTGRYQLSGDEVFATEMFMEGDCPLALQDQDSHVVSVIGDGFTIAVDDGELVLTSTGDEGLVYSARGPTAPYPILPGGISLVLG